MKTVFFLPMMSTFFCTTVYAAELNQRTRLPPEAQVKVNQQIAKAYSQGQEAQSQAEQSLSNATRGAANANAGGSNQTINSFNNVRYAPKEVITAVRGDIINVCFHCR